MTHDTTTDISVPERRRNGTTWGIAACCTFPCIHGCELGEHAYCLWDCPDSPGRPPGQCTCGFCEHIAARGAELAAASQGMQNDLRAWRAAFPLLAALWDWTAQAAGSDDEWQRRRQVTMAEAARDLDAAMARRDAAEAEALRLACLDLEKRAAARERRLGL